jgi:hypothetical protein
MHQAIPQLVRTLRNLDGILAKAEAYAKSRSFDVNNFLTARLAPDMFPLVRQVRIACDHAKSVAQALSGKELPKHEDNEASFDDLHARIAKCVAVIEGLKPSDFDAVKPDTIIKMPNRPGKGMRAGEYVWRRQIPNFYFHVTTAYNLLRAGGVDLGKSDFLGPLDIVDL